MHLVRRPAFWLPLFPLVFVAVAGCGHQPKTAIDSSQPPLPVSAATTPSAAPGTTPASNPVSAMSGPSAVPPRFVRPTDLDYPTLLGGPPADDSDAHRAELDRLLSLQADRTPAQVARCRAEEVVDVFAFANVLGAWFSPRDLPATAALMQQTYVDGRAASDAAKVRWNRVRPFLADKRVKPCVKLEPSTSFPSGHATRGAMWGALLSDAFPEKAEKLAARGKEIGTNRVLGGMHWPTDVEAGHVLGLEIARRLLADPAFVAEWEKAKAEMRAAVR